MKHALLALYFARVQTLRAHLLSRLPASSRIRRKRLGSVGLTADPSPVEQRLCRLLDSALVACSGVSGGDTPSSSGLPSTDDRQQQRLAYAEHRKADESHVTIADAQEGPFSPQSEVRSGKKWRVSSRLVSHVGVAHENQIVDFAVWLLFKRAKQNARLPQKPGDAARWSNDLPENVLCHGFQRGQGPQHVGISILEGGGEEKPFSAYPCSSTIPDLFCTKPPQHAQTLKESPWPQLLALLGASGEKIMIDLLIDCSIFLPVEGGRRNFVQATGQLTSPLSWEYERHRLIWEIRLRQAPVQLGAIDCTPIVRAGSVF